MSRDLKADLERSNQAMQNSLANWYDFLVANGERWLNEAIAEKERADKYRNLTKKLLRSLEENQMLLEGLGYPSNDIPTLIRVTKEALDNEK